MPRTGAISKDFSLQLGIIIWAHLRPREGAQALYCPIRQAGEISCPRYA